MSALCQQFGAGNGGTDEWYTPEWAVNVIADYLPRGGYNILCPFDTKESAFYRVLTERGHKVETSHIFEGVNFFQRDLNGFDYVISNPPYSIRDEILKRLYDAKVKFAMLLNSSSLFDSKTRIRIANRGVGVIWIYPRVQYVSTDGEVKSVPFQSCYWTKGIIPDGMNVYYEKDENPKDQIKMEVC